MTTTFGEAMGLTVSGQHVGRMTVLDAWSHPYFDDPDFRMVAVRVRMEWTDPPDPRDRTTYSIEDVNWQAFDEKDEVYIEGDSISPLPGGQVPLSPQDFSGRDVTRASIETRGWRVYTVAQHVWVQLEWMLGQPLWLLQLI